MTGEGAGESSYGISQVQEGDEEEGGWPMFSPLLMVQPYADSAELHQLIQIRGGTNKTNPVVGRRFGAFPVADLTAVLVVRSCYGPSPQDRPGGCSDFSIGVVLEMRKEGWNYLKALQYSIGIILYGF